MSICLRYFFDKTKMKMALPLNKHTGIQFGWTSDHVPLDKTLYSFRSHQFEPFVEIFGRKIVFANVLRGCSAQHEYHFQTNVNEFIVLSLVKDRMMKYQFCHSFRNNNKPHPMCVCAVLCCSMTINEIQKWLKYGLASDVSALSPEKRENILEKIISIIHVHRKWKVRHRSVRMVSDDTSTQYPW